MIVAGFGFRGGAEVAALRAALGVAGAGCPPVTALAVPDDKTKPADQLAWALALPLIAVAADGVAGVATPTWSAFSLRHRGTGSVAEAVALAAAGPGARLIVRRCISPDRMATCAIAEGIDS